MNRHLHLALCLISTAALNALPARAGDLNPPPGPVTPTLKTLQQVEPRTPINATTTPGNASYSFIISQPGSYYLTGNIIGQTGKGAIHITSDNVTLDLMGFSLIGNSVNATGITTNSFRLGVVIRNGTVSNWGTGGINVSIDAGRIEHITAFGNGATGIANNTGSYTTHIISCEAVQNLESGFSVGGDTIVRDCIASLNGTAGISGTAGIYAIDRAIIDSCTVFASHGDGIYVRNNCIVRGSRATTNGTASAAIRAAGSRNIIEANSITNSTIGIAINSGGSRNQIRENLVSGCTDAYQLTSDNELSLILSDIPEAIDWPANVRLASNLTRTTAGPGITINSDDVIIDLGGYALIGNGLQSFASSGIISTSTRSNIVIRNGALRNWGHCGVELSTGKGITLERLDATSNLGDGIRSGTESFISNCRASNNNTNGFSIGSFSKIENCIAISNGVHGFSLSGVVTCVRCEASSNGQAAGTVGAGFFVGGSWVNGRIEECFTYFNEAGFDIDGAGWLIVRNIARGNSGGNFNISAGNNAGSTVASPAGAGANDNISY